MNWTISAVLVTAFAAQALGQEASPVEADAWLVQKLRGDPGVEQPCRPKTELSVE